MRAYKIIVAVVILALSFWAGARLAAVLPPGEKQPASAPTPAPSPEPGGGASPAPDPGAGAPTPTPTPTPGSGDPDYARLQALAEEAARTYGAAPVDAAYNSAYSIVVPERNGYAVNREATLERLLAAQPGQTVSPVWREIAPAVRAADYPLAAINRGCPDSPRVTLMINVAWGNEYLPGMLDILERHGVKTTFFPVGRWAEQFPELLQAIHARGHELGNHGYADWEVMSDLDAAATRESLARTNQIIHRFTGQEPRYFTPHKGEYGAGTLEAAAGLGMRLLMWTLDTVDWQRPGAQVMAARILDNLVPGAIILMHPTGQSAEFLELLLSELARRGYRMVPARELLSPSPELPAVTLRR